MRIIFMGSPDFAVPTLDALVAAGHEVPAVYCQPPRPAGRGKADRKTPVQERAEALGLEVRHPRSLRNPEEQAMFAALNADLAVVAAYGLILPKPILDAPKGGCVNIHASLLPRWRGAAPIHRAILAGDEETGITIMQMDQGLDTGPMLLNAATRCRGKHQGHLEKGLAHMGAELILRYLENPTAYPPKAQPSEGLTYAEKVRKEELRINFRASAEEVDRQIDAFNPPGAYFEFQNERIRILKADWDKSRGIPGEVLNDRLQIACGEDAISPVRVQRAGRAEMGVDELLRGFAIPKGTILP